MKCFFRIGRYQLHWYGFSGMKWSRWQKGERFNPHHVKRIDLGPISVTCLNKWCQCTEQDVSCEEFKATKYEYRKG